jgi:hypothetical protein
MTYQQESMWLHEQLGGSPFLYLESWVYKLTGPFDEAAAEWALGEVVRRHEALRTGLTMDEERLIQVVRPYAGISLRRRPAREGDLETELRRTVSEPLDLQDSPLRATLLRVTPQECVLVVQIHHSAIDDWALSILDREFGLLYRSRIAGSPAQLEPLTTQIGEYAVAQRAAGVDQSVLDYWRKHLEDLPEQTTVPADRPRPAELSLRGGQARFGVDPLLGDRIRGTARRLRATPFVLLTAALTALLHGYTGADDLIVGTAVSLRGPAELDPLIGCLTNLLPLRLRGVQGRSFAELVAITREALHSAMAHGNIPYSHLIRETVTSEDMSKVPLCQTMIGVDDAARVPLDLPGVTAERLYVHPGTVKFELGLTLVADHGGYQGFLDYATDLYDPATADRVADGFQSTLAVTVQAPGRPLAGLLCESAET